MYSNLSTNQQQLLSFFYPLINSKKLKSILNITKEKNFKRFSLYKKFASTHALKLGKLNLIKKTNKNILKNFKFDKFEKYTASTKNSIYIKISPNNTMITWTDLKGNVLYKISAGMLGLHSSKKNYKLINNMVLTEFFKRLKKEKKKKNLLFKISAPKILRRRLLRRLKFYMRSKNFFEGLRKLAFNGCRPAKMRRKKRKGLKIFKPVI